VLKIQSHVSALDKVTPRRGAALGRCFKGVLLIESGRYDTGLRPLCTGLDELRETGSILRYTAFLGALAEGLIGTGNFAEELAAVDEELERSERNEEFWCLAQLLRIKGELVLLEDAPDAAAAAEDHFRQALGWARGKEALS
jgi:hypothetical protein